MTRRAGRLQVTSLVAAVAIAAVLMFLTAPLAYLPRAALAAIVISAVIGLFDNVPLAYYYRVSGAEFAFRSSRRSASSRSACCRAS